MKRKSFEGLVLRALHMILQSVVKYSGPKAAKHLHDWKADARAYLDEPWEPAADEIAHAEAIAEAAVKPPCGECGQPLGTERNCPSCQAEWLTQDMARP